jgi:glucosamine-phosphate N-acetyltransferase
MGKVAHIEDVVVDKEYRSHGLGKLLIQDGIKIANREKCYKIILDCEEKNVGFYEKCGFEKKGIQMAKYN